MEYRIRTIYGIDSIKDSGFKNSDYNSLIDWNIQWPKCDYNKQDKDTSWNKPVYNNRIFSIMNKNEAKKSL